MNRRYFLRAMGITSVVPAVIHSGCAAASGRKNVARPNILFCIADDQSYPHAGAYGDKVVKTPHFDRVAKEGVLFTHSFCAAPSCTPSRAAVLTGQEIWRLGRGAVLRGPLSKSDYRVYPSLLEEAGYHVGFTGKGWGPGNTAEGGWGRRNPAGKAYNAQTSPVPVSGIAETDYAANFQDFLSQRPGGTPFCFWFGCKEPHRPYAQSSGAAALKAADDIHVPSWLPDAPDVRGDMADYYMEIEWCDSHLGRMLDVLEQIGEIDNTLIVVTSDNGMPFPRAKASLYDSGTRMPLAIRWAARVKGGRVIDDFVSHTDFAPTFLQAAGLPVPPEMTGRSLFDVLMSDKSGRVNPDRDKVVTAFERHTICRLDEAGYPMRALRTHRWLYIRNYEPSRWPAGDPLQFRDCDDGPTKNSIINRGNPEQTVYFQRAFAKRPAEELYDVVVDPDQLHNLAHDPAFAQDKKGLCRQLDRYLAKTQDPRFTGQSPWR